MYSIYEIALLEICISVVHFERQAFNWDWINESNDNVIWYEISVIDKLFLSNFFLFQVVDKSIVSNLDIIVVNILLCLYDREEDEFIKTPIIR